MKKLALLIIVYAALITFSHSATYYMAPTGSDDNSGSSASRWRTFGHSFSEMSSGDILILGDGTYSLANGTGVISSTGTGSGQPPSGTSGGFTIVQAETIGGAVIDPTGVVGGGSGDARYLRGVFLGASSRVDSYIKISGIKVIGNRGVYFFNTDHCYLKNTAVNGMIIIGSNDHSDSCDYNLIEDCWAWSNNNRTLTMSYEGRYNIWRRVVVRGDGDSTSPAVAMSAYNSTDILYQNCIVIDRLVDSSAAYGDFASAMHATGALNYPLSGIQWVGCISINSQDTGFHMEADDVDLIPFYLKNIIVLNSNDTTASINVGRCPDIIIEGATLITSVPWDYGIVLWNPTAPIVRDIIIAGGATYGISGGGDVDYVDMYGTYTTPYRYGTCETGCLTVDPTSNGLLYPVRTETGSTVEDYGAEIVFRHGTEGSFYGDAGYNTLSDVALWPWPNEGRIKIDMSVDYSAATEARGFCAAGTRLDGINPITLTSYIWEYLGNEIPEDIYGEVPAYDNPTITGPADFSTTSSSVEINGSYTNDPDLPDPAVTVTWTLGESSGFCVAALGVFTCTVPVELGANSIVFRVVDSVDGEDSDTTVVTRTAPLSGNVIYTGSMSGGTYR